MAKVEGTNLEAVYAAYEKEQASRGRFAPKEPGEYLVRILPPIIKPGSDGLYFRKWGIHYDVAEIAAGTPSDRRSLACLKDTLDQNCPLCAAVQQMYAHARTAQFEDKATLSKAGRVRAKLRYVMNVVDMENQKNGVQTWEIGKDAHALIQPIFKRWHDITRTDWDEPKDQQQGQVLSVTYTKKDKWTVISNIQPTNMNTPIEIKDWQAARKDFDQYVQQYLVSAEDMRKWILTKREELPVLQERRGVDEPLDDTDDDMDPVMESDPTTGGAGNGDEVEELSGVVERPVDPAIFQSPELKKLLAKAIARRQK